VAKFSDRLDRVVVQAPAAGLVQEIMPRARGEVVMAGELIARIVQREYEFVAEVRIDPKDAGFVQVGAPANVKFANYDGAPFGTLTGTVE
jgi:membrane fusion protein, adhesin transport system